MTPLQAPPLHDSFDAAGREQPEMAWTQMWHARGCASSRSAATLVQHALSGGDGDCASCLHTWQLHICVVSSEPVRRCWSCDQDD